MGLSGQAIMENGKVKNLKYISSINVRMSHEILGCADGLLPYVTFHRRLYHTLLVSPPGCGKTTLLRDLIRQISEGNEFIKGMSVGVVDERSEIAGCYRGVAQNHLGIRTDVLDGCPKAEGMIMLIRCVPKLLQLMKLEGVKMYMLLNMQCIAAAVCLQQLTQILWRNYKRNQYLIG